MGKTSQNQDNSKVNQGKNKKRGKMSNYFKGRGGGGGYASAYGPDGKKKEYLHPGLKGFLLSTNFREKECVREAYNLLNEYVREEDKGEVVMEVEGGGGVDKDWRKKEKVGHEEGGEGVVMAGGGGPEQEEEEEDIGKALEKELKQIKNTKSFFQCVDTGVKNNVFIKTTVKKPGDIVYRIFHDVFEQRKCKSRNILRFTPVEGTCRNEEQSIRTLAKEIFTPYFKEGYKRFKIVPNIRYCNNIKSKDLIVWLAEVVNEISPLNIVHLTEPEYTVLVDVLKSTVCLAVIKDYLKYKKYNITEIISPSPAPKKPEQEEQSHTGASTLSEQKQEVGEAEDHTVPASIPVEERH